MARKPASGKTTKAAGGRGKKARGSDLPLGDVAADYRHDEAKRKNNPPAGLVEFDKPLWGDGPTDGLGAMVGAWSAWADASAAGRSLREQPAMREIERYNHVDCRVMYEVIDFVRRSR